MTSSNGSICRVTGPLCGEFTSYRWIPITKASDAELWCFLWSTPEQTVESAIERPVVWDAHYDITVKHNRHPMACPWGRDMGCLFDHKFWFMFCISHCSPVWNIMFYLTGIYYILVICISNIKHQDKTIRPFSYFSGDDDINTNVRISISIPSKPFSPNAFLWCFTCSAVTIQTNLGGYVPYGRAGYWPHSVRTICWDSLTSDCTGLGHLRCAF